MDLRGSGAAKDNWHLTDELHAEQGKGDPFAAAIRATRMAMLITDPRKTDNPIVFANSAFFKLTGYAREEVVGRNCRFLQGEETDPEAVRRIREAVENRRDITVDILNYRKDGTEFWNALYISPVTNEAGELQFYFASQLDITDRKQSEQRLAADKERFEQAVRDRTAELQEALDAQETLLHEVDHRVKNNLQMVASLIVMQSRAITDERTRASLRSMLERIEALSTVHRRLYQSKDVSRFDLADFIRDLVNDLLAASGRDGIRTAFDLAPVEISADKATPVALIINELVTNAIKHAFAHDREGGSLDISLSRADGHYKVVVADDGPGISDEPSGSSFGTKLIRSLSRQLHADIQWQSTTPGTAATLTIPLNPNSGES